MALSLVGRKKVSSSGVDSLDFSGISWQPGDLCIVFAFRDGSNTAPSLPAGWTNIANGGGSSCSSRLGYRILQSGDTSTGVWTNATELVYVIIRGADPTTPIGGNNNGDGIDNTVDYEDIVFTDGDGSSWVFAFGASRSATNMDTAVPSGLTAGWGLATDLKTITVHHSNGGLSSWPLTTVTVGTATGWRTSVVEVIETTNAAPNAPTLDSPADAATLYADQTIVFQFDATDPNQ